MTAARSVRVLAALALIAVLGACGGSITPPMASGGRSGGPGGGADATPTSPPFATAGPVAGDQVVTIQPVMNDPTGPCGAVTTTVPIAQAPAPCISVWSDLDAQSVPGNDVLASSGISTTVRVAKGLDLGEAKLAAAAFYKAAALEYWALSQPNVALLEALYPQGYASPVLHAIHAGQSVVSVPRCWLPVSLRVAQLTSDETAFFAARGYPAPAPLVVLATYGACPGLTMSGAGGNARQEFGNAQPDTAVITGSVGEPDAPGTVWLTSGTFSCGDDHLRHVCGR